MATIFEEDDLNSLDLAGAMAGDISGVQAIADPNADLDEIIVDDHGNPDAAAKVTAGDDDSLNVSRTPGFVDEEPVVKVVQKEEKVVLDEVEKAGSETKPEEKTKTEEKEVVLPDDGKRISLAKVSPRRALELQLLAQNEQMTLDQVRDYIEKNIENAPEADELVPYEELSVEDQLEADREELKEVRDLIREKDRNLIRDDEWEAASKRANDLADQVAVKTIEAKAAKDSRIQIEVSRQESEATANTEFPELTDEGSDLYALVAGRVQQIVELSKNEKALPKNAEGVVLDPRSPKFPLLVAQEQAARLKRLNGVEAKPAPTEVEKSGRSKIGPVPGASTTQHARNESEDVDGDLTQIASRVENDDDLDALIQKALKGPSAR